MPLTLDQIRSEQAPKQAGMSGCFDEASAATATGAVGGRDRGRIGIACAGTDARHSRSADIRDDPVGLKVVISSLTIDKMQRDPIAIYFGAGLAIE